MASKSTFPDDIMIEILLKLPVKSILRCNALSKHYYSLIHSQFFIRRHLNLGRRLSDKPYNQLIASPILGSLRLFDRRGHVKVLDGLPSIVEESLLNVDECMLCGPVDGLYCVIDTKHDRFAVWNPSTRETFNLPSVSQLCSHFINKWDSRIAFEVDYYCNECVACGFGYDHTSNDYKLIVIYGFLACTDEDFAAAYAMFYTMNIGKGEWRITEMRVYFDPWDIKSSVGVITCGAWHWVYECSFEECYKILAFDMLIESQKFIPFPMVGDGYEWSDMSIFSFNGCLGLVHAQRGDNMKELSSSFDVWVMVEYGVTESWATLFHVSLEDGIGGRFLGIVRDRFYISEGEGWLVSYDIVSKDEERNGILDGEVRSLLPYEESLVSIIK